uniref:BOP1NT domain-containing protein n=1 Tax=Anopheles funestus TaxID=62324 RepID=A0A4Y0BDW8_ANOFN
MGWMKTFAEKRRLEAIRRAPKFYMLWRTDHGTEEMRRIHDHVVAPKRPLPGHAESYNPPPEYLFDEKELDQWKKARQGTVEAEASIRAEEVQQLARSAGPMSDLLRNGFCAVWICNCVRVGNVRALSLVRNIYTEVTIARAICQPFPTLQNLIYKGHTNMIRCISVERRVNTW